MPIVLLLAIVAFVVATIAGLSALFPRGSYKGSRSEVLIALIFLVVAIILLMGGGFLGGQ